jgi:two-component system KDP operon response regulator KdpE
VLVVDDDIMIRTVACTLLRQMGARAVGVGNSHDAAAELASSAATDPIGVVLLDVNLQGELGTDVCRRFRADGIAIPIVAMSGDAYASEALRNAGFTDGIVKPFSGVELHACIERQLGP